MVGKDVAGAASVVIDKVKFDYRYDPTNPASFQEYNALKGVLSSLSGASSKKHPRHAWTTTTIPMANTAPLVVGHGNPRGERRATFEWTASTITPHAAVTMSHFF